ncbi:hypothetical protein B0H16DRAFT_1788151 [Mycena metata]|uniref:Uncharacterized protein n=1 Tax=Mycena metata TaxID=1033252 RepID=A0AAD7HKU9_9AGAR|nr:hypothetical protein B0H16DRAFT_1788151 [Mycena metata]
MAQHSASHTTCPQELIDLILDEVDPTEKDTLKSLACALVARSFRPTSQKLIFSDLTIDHDSILALQRLEVVLSASPHLAQYSTISAAILSVLDNVKSLRTRIDNWHYLDSTCEQAIYALITRSSLSSIEIDGATFQTNRQLVTFLQCFPASLESASLSKVFTNWTNLLSNSLQFEHQLRLTSLDLGTPDPVLFQWAIRAVDFRCLHVTFDDDAMDAIQRLLDVAINVETYHLSFYDCWPHAGSPNLEKMQRLRTLEISVELNWTEILQLAGQGEDNPLNDAMRALATAPPTVEHLVLNLDIYNPDELPNFMGSAVLNDLDEGLPALQDVALRIVSSYDDDAALQRGIRYVEAVFSRLHQRGMLTAIVVPRPNLNRIG